MEEKESELELQALESIFMNNFQCDPDRTSFKVTVVPSFGGAFKNHLAITFSASFPSNYPLEPLQNIDLSLVEGTMLQDSINYLKDLVIEECSKSIGSPMAFSAIEKLKEHLEMYNQDITEGSFILLSNEIIIKILSYLEVNDLSQMARINKNIKSIAEDNVLWRDICEEEPNISPLIQSLEEKEDVNWKKEYIEAMGFQVPDLEYIAVILDRKGTGDEWMVHVGHVAPYHACFISEMKSFGWELIGKKRGKILFNSTIVGYYKFEDEIPENFPWKSLHTNLVKECPYVGKILGCFRFGLKRFDHSFFKSVLRISRGFIGLSDQPNDFIYCVKKSNMRLVNLLNLGKNPYVFDEMGLLVNPRSTKKRVLYLNEIVDQVNTHLIPFQVKSKEPHKPVKKPVEYASGQTLYPFVLDEDSMVKNFKQQGGYLQIAMWIYNDSEISIL